MGLTVKPSQVPSSRDLRRSRRSRLTCASTTRPRSRAAERWRTGTAAAAGGPCCCRPLLMAAKEKARSAARTNSQRRESPRGWRWCPRVAPRRQAPAVQVKGGACVHPLALCLTGAQLWLMLTEGEEDAPDSGNSRGGMASGGGGGRQTWAPLAWSIPPHCIIQLPSWLQPCDLLLHGHGTSSLPHTKHVSPAWGPHPFQPNRH